MSLRRSPSDLRLHSDRSSVAESCRVSFPTERVSQRKSQRSSVAALVFVVSEADQPDRLKPQPRNGVLLSNRSYSKTSTSPSNSSNRSRPLLHRSELENPRSSLRELRSTVSLKPRHPFFSIFQLHREMLCFQLADVLVVYSSCQIDEASGGHSRITRCNADPTTGSFAEHGSNLGFKGRLCTYEPQRYGRSWNGRCGTADGFCFAPRHGRWSRWTCYQRRTHQLYGECLGQGDSSFPHGSNPSLVSSLHLTYYFVLVFNRCFVLYSNRAKKEK